MSDPALNWVEPIYWITITREYRTVAERIPHPELKRRLLRTFWVENRGFAIMVTLVCLLTGGLLFLTIPGSVGYRIAASLFPVLAGQGLVRLLLYFGVMAVSKPNYPQGEIEIRSDGIVRIVEGKVVDNWPFVSMRRVQLKQIVHHVGTYVFMRIRMKDRRWHEVAVDPDLSIHSIKSVLERFGVRVGISEAKKHRR